MRNLTTRLLLMLSFGLIWSGASMKLKGQGTLPCFEPGEIYAQVDLDPCWGDVVTFTHNFNDLVGCSADSTIWEFFTLGGAPYPGTTVQTVGFGVQVPVALVAPDSCIVAQITIFSNPHIVMAADTFCYTINTYAPPSANLTAAPNPACTGDVVTLSGPWTGTGWVDFTIDWGDGNNTAFTDSSIAPPLFVNQTHTYTSPGTYIITTCLDQVDCQTRCFNDTIVVVDGIAEFSWTDACEGDAVQFTDLSNCASSWLWDFGDGQSSTQQNPVHFYAQAGTYTVSLSINGGSQSVSHAVTIYPAPTPEIVGPSTVCDANNATYTVAGNPNVSSTYTWTATNAFPATGTGPSFTTQWGLGGTGTLILTETDGNGCTGSDTLEIVECCTRHGATLIEDGKLASQLISSNGGNSTFTSELFAVNGTFIVDQDMEWVQCEAIFGKNAKIIVKPNVRFFIRRNSWLHACGPDMWDGIYVEGGGTIMIHDKTLVQDAQQAVVSQDGGNYDLLGSIFDLNWIAVKVEPFAGAHQGIMRSCVVSCTNEGAMLSPHFATRSLYGFLIEDVQDIQIGDDNFTPSRNTFDRVRTGIHAKRSNVRVFNNLFLGEQPQRGVAVPYIGVEAINVPGFIIIPGTQRSLIVGNTNLSGGNEFRDIAFGVLASQNVTTSIEQNEFYALYGRGVSVSQCNQTQVTIQDNSFEGTAYPISSLLNSASTVNIRRNDMIYGGPVVGAGIVVADVNTGLLFPPNVSIEENELHFHGTGIWVMSTRNTRIADNNPVEIVTPSSTNPIPVYGILVQGSPNVEIVHNNLKATSPANLGVRGIWVENSAQTFVECNNILRFGQHLTFSGQCPDSETWRNSMQFGTYGLVLTNQGLIGPQGAQGNPSDNKWVGNSFIFAESYTEGLFTNDPSSLNPIYIRANSNYIPNPNLNLTPALPFDLLYTCLPGQSPCLPVQGCSGGGGNNPNLALLPKIALDQIPFGQWAAESKFMDREHLYEAMRNDPSLMNNAVLAGAWPGLQNGIIGGLNGAKDAAGAGAWTQGYWETQSLNPTIMPEMNHKQVTTAWINHFGAWTNPVGVSDLNALLSLAHQCPYEGGHAVYEARAMLEIIQPGEIYVNDCAGSGASLKTGMDETSASVSRYELFPNPSAGSFTIRGECDSNTIAEVYDLQCRKLLSSGFSAENCENRIDLSEQPAGLYIVKVSNPSGKVWIGKFMLNR